MIEPTHYAPLWQEEHRLVDAEGCYFVAETTADRYGIIPAERVTITPEPYEPQVGDRVMTTHGYEATILATRPDLLGRIAIAFRLPGGERYTTLDPADIDGSVQ